MKVDILFLDQKVCDYYNFIPKPDSEAIRPSINDIKLTNHTKKAILVNVNNSVYWIAKSLIRSISETGDNHSIFENEPYYDKYIDNIKLESIKNEENNNV